MTLISNNQFMIDEIKEEPALFSQILEEKKRYTEGFVRLFTENNIKKIFFIGSGSPSHLSTALKYAAVKLLKVDAVSEFPSLFLYHDDFDPNNVYKPSEMLLVCPVESGKTKGPLLAAQKAKERGMHVVCTTLDEGGCLAQTSDVVIKKPSGAEKAPPTTKGHSTAMFLLLLCMVEAARATGALKETDYTMYQKGFAELSKTIENATQKSLEWFNKNKDAVMNASSYWFLGYGANYATASEAVLKFIESHQKPTFAYELEEFLHGPLCALKTEDLIFFFAAEDCPEKERLLLLYHTMKTSYPNCVLIQTSKSAIEAPDAMTFDSVNLEFLNMLEFLIPVQVLSYAIADNAGIDVTVWTTKPIRDVMQPSFA
ncbi:MAG: SIS domain-containing protein [Candidatus Moranbacteria bacterium]|nr:SIS domain-containing protein [Candidatus Moranbacteria bacterium]